MKIVAVVLLALSYVVAVHAETADKVPVYVFATPNDGGFVDAASKARDASALDLQHALAKSRTLTVVESADLAAITVEITARGYDPAGSSTTSSTRMPYTGQVVSSTVGDVNPTVHAVLHVGDYSTPMDGVTPSALLREAAKVLAKKLETWVQDNRARLPAK